MHISCLLSFHPTASYTLVSSIIQHKLSQTYGIRNFLQSILNGRFTHYLAGLQGCGGPNAQGSTDCGPSAWNATVTAFDPEAYASSAAATGAKYAVITMMQGSKFMLGPNMAYDTLTGYRPGEACSERDLVLEIARALRRRGLDLMLYWTGDGPHEDQQASTGLGLSGCPNPPNHPDCRHDVPILFTERWGSVLEEYAIRYGSLVRGWWVDGCYRYFDYDDNKLQAYSKAIKKVYCS